jgi:hypothetical protein
MVCAGGLLASGAERGPEGMRGSHRGHARRSGGVVLRHDHKVVKMELLRDGASWPPP